jgi:hypothetical protein
MKTVAPLTSESTVSFCSFTFSGTYSIVRVQSDDEQLRVSRPRHGRRKLTADLAMRVTRARGSSKFSMPSETASCCACAWADAGALALSFRGMSDKEWRVAERSIQLGVDGDRDDGMSE